VGKESLRTYLALPPSGSTDRFREWLGIYLIGLVKMLKFCSHGDDSMVHSTFRNVQSRSETRTPGNTAAQSTFPVATNSQS
jgi:hypothetical protein